MVTDVNKRLVYAMPHPYARVRALPDRFEAVWNCRKTDLALSYDPPQIIQSLSEARRAKGQRDLITADVPAGTNEVENGADGRSARRKRLMTFESALRPDRPLNPIMALWLIKCSALPDPKFVNTVSRNGSPDAGERWNETCRLFTDCRELLTAIRLDIIRYVLRPAVIPQLDVRLGPGEAQRVARELTLYVGFVFHQILNEMGVDEAARRNLAQNLAPAIEFVLLPFERPRPSEDTIMAAVRTPWLEKLIPASGRYAAAYQELNELERALSPDAVSEREGRIGDLHKALVAVHRRRRAWQHTPEAKRKMRAAAKRRWKKPKQRAEMSVAMQRVAAGKTHSGPQTSPAAAAAGHVTTSRA